MLATVGNCHDDAGALVTRDSGNLVCCSDEHLVASDGVPPSARKAEASAWPPVGTCFVARAATSDVLLLCVSHSWEQQRESRPRAGVLSS
jgi:hypothetical protein